jgi:ubiquinone/menaquinone biosynthesis C-methylase UbiE
MSKDNGIKIPVSKEVAAGAAGYSKFILSIYDIEVLMFEMRFIFKCPSHNILDFYNKHISDKHLDVGVGTGYFLDKCKFPVDNPTVHLMDLNLNSLQKTSDRIKRYNPVSHNWNVLEPIQEDLPTFNSICACNLLHCLPGTMLSKEVVFKNLKRVLNPGGVFFGLTVLGQGVDAGALYRIVNPFYNRMSAFCNLNDNRSDLEKILKNNFKDYSVQVIGSVAFFAGHA